VAQPIAVAAGAQVEVDACVTPPATQSPETAQKIYFQAQSAAAASNGVIVRDAVTDAVTVTTAPTFSAVVTPNNSGQVAPGGTVVYAHSLINTGNQSCGAYNLSATLPAADAAAGWTTAIYLDTNGNGVIDAADTLVTGPQSGLAVGATQKFLVKVFAPGAGIAGATDLVTVTATFTSGDCGQPSATDTGTVVTGQIRVVKAQVLDAACTGVAGTFSAATFAVKPGQCVIYQVIATNQGSGPVSNVSIGDAVPAFTSLTGATQPPAQCVPVGMTGTPVFANTVTTVSCGSAANTVAPGGTLTLTYAVKVNQ
jgi:uncharacterized repeat protein (TIGR01451 family)